MTWTFLGSGSFNRVYKNDNLIFKVAHPLSSDSENANPVNVMDNYARSIRIWNEINPNLRPPAYIKEMTIGSKKVIGWVCPYVEGVQATDEEISQKLLDIYNQTGRIIVDATAKNNFIRTPSGEIVCIDIGMAVQLESRNDAQLIGLKRRSSFSSLDTWNAMQNKYVDWFQNTEHHHIVTPKTIQTIKALLFIKQHRPDITNVNFLTTDLWALPVLAYAFDLENPPNQIIPSQEQKQAGIYQAESLLAHHVDLSLEAIKEFCRGKLTAVITPSTSPTQLSEEEREFNTQYAIALLKQINQSNTQEELLPIFASIEELEKSSGNSTPESPFIPINSEPFIHQLNQNLLKEFNHREEITTLKQNCTQILLQFIHQYGHLEEQELEELKNQLRHSPRNKVQYYKEKMENQKLTDLEKQVITLVKEIENATTLEEIDEFILKFEQAQSKNPPKSPQSIIGYLSSYFVAPSPEEKLSKSISECKIALASTKASLEKKFLEEQNQPRGPDLV